MTYWKMSRPHTKKPPMARKRLRRGIRLSSKSCAASSPAKTACGTNASRYATKTGHALISMVRRTSTVMLVSRARALIYRFSRRDSGTALHQ